MFIWAHSSYCAVLSVIVLGIVSSTSSSSTTQRAVILPKHQLPWQECPSWIPQLVAVQKQALKSPLKTKVVLYTCTRKTALYCGGIGDRIRAGMEAVKLAISSNRSVLLHWSFPSHLEQVLEPSQVDWRLQPSYALNGAPTAYYKFGGGMGIPAQLIGPSFAARHQGTRVVAISSNVYDKTLLMPGPTLGGIVSNARSCLFNTLFRPTQALQKAVDHNRRCLFGSDSKPYAAIHLRLGGFRGEQKSLNRFDGFKGLLSALSCAKALAESVKLQPPILLITDNIMLRRLVLNGTFTDVVSTPFEAVNIIGAQSASSEAMWTSFVDLALLAQATCLVGSPSGFSDTALNWGRHACYLPLAKCIQAYADPFYSG